MSKDEEFVRSAWEHVIVCDGSYRHYAKGTVLLNWANHCFYEFNSFTAAAEFTRDHLEQVRCAEQNVFSLNEQIGTNIDILLTMPDEIDAPFAVSIGEDLARLGRIIEHEQTALKSLKAGLK